MPTIVITGGNRGIGLELARLYAGAGDRVILGVRKPSLAPGLSAEFRELDVSSDSSVRSFAKGLQGTPVDVLINNAGTIGPSRQSSLDADFDGFLETLNINTIGPLRVTQALLPNLRLAGHSKVVIISSRMGSLSYAKSDHLAYRASKAAVNKVTQGLATDLEAEGIAVAAVHPGWVRTDMGGPSADISPEESARGIKSVIAGLGAETSGRFWNYDGDVVPW